MTGKNLKRSSPLMVPPKRCCPGPQMLNMKSALPSTAMVITQVALVGSTLAQKKAIQTGMHNLVYIFYTNAITSFILLPLAFFNYRSSTRPTLTISVAGGFLGLGILGFIMQVIAYVGIAYASATEATAILNLVPGFISLFAVIFGLEKLGNGGLAKIIGTLVSVIGAIIATLYTGPTIITPRLSSIDTQQSSDVVLGGLIMLVDSVLSALFIIAQALILKKYSAVLIVVLGYGSTITLLSLLASMILEHDLNLFNIQSKTRLLAILYSGLFGSGFQITILLWCLKMKGPLFVAIFQPLGIVIAAILGVLFLGDGLYLGCVIGSVIIVVGFYGVMWGKSKEDKSVEVESSKSPLLKQNSDMIP
ncbi:hypothetical protein QVD17_31505 [Tagetes erecta]|uniref:WAT1-related protein n=1 Tax=Tagetes erecta TaxID=13708 RepID=A0AAD8K9X1_TARER|nr:hypothetical protein QVD17_31505 [Tagetes erecta]